MGDIKGCYNHISHDLLMKVLFRKIKDQRFLQLIKKALNSGFLYDNKPFFDIIDLPQTSIIGPIQI